MGSEMCIRDSFTPWFKQEWRELVGNYREQLARYCDLAGVV